MPHLSSAAATSLGFGGSLALGMLTYLFQNISIQNLVYSTYAGFVAPGVQLFEVAWLLATIDWLLDLSVGWSLILWTCFAVVVALGVRQPSGVLKAVSTGILLPAGIWLLFAYKYLALSGLGAALPSFLLWRLFTTLCFGCVVASVLTIPFLLRGRKLSKPAKASMAVRFVCQRCGAEYKSNPAVCVRCGAEGTVRRVD